MKKINLLPGIVIGAIATAGVLFFSGHKTTLPLAGPYLTTAPYMPEDLEFAGENVPLENPEVYERMDKELISNCYFHSNTIINMKRANKYFPTIEKILAQEGVPDDFKYLAVIESNLSNVVSPSGAAGYWQFLANTGKGYGLEIDQNIDERYHLEKSTVAACKYLKEAYAKFNSWTLAAASYNMGMNSLNSRILDQGQQSYYDLLLYEETQRYVYRILAVKSIFSQPMRYGFYILEQEKYQKPATKALKVESIDCISCFCKENKISYKDFRWLNPWVREKTLMPKSGKTYEILVFK